MYLRDEDHVVQEHLRGIVDKLIHLVGVQYHRS
jgi:hypothetical protein